LCDKDLYGKTAPFLVNFYDTIHTCIEYWHVNNKYQAAFGSIARSRQTPFQEPGCQPRDKPPGSRPPGARSLGVTAPAGRCTASRPAQVLSPALICRSRRGSTALQNAPKTSAAAHTGDRLPSPLAVRRKTRKALRWRGLGRLQNWIGQNVRRRKAYPESRQRLGLPRH